MGIAMNSDFRDLLRLFAKHEVRYLVVGGYAAMHYSQPRVTNIRTSISGWTRHPKTPIAF